MCRHTHTYTHSQVNSSCKKVGLKYNARLSNKLKWKRSLQFSFPWTHHSDGKLLVLNYFDNSVWMRATGALGVSTWCLWRLICIDSHLSSPTNEEDEIGDLKYSKPPWANTEFPVPALRCPFNCASTIVTPPNVNNQSLLQTRAIAKL